jgi:curved DNA-binding protein
MDYYKTLGLKKSANTNDIKGAYRRLAKQHHPDRGGDSETFKNINEAYSTLIDAEKRTEYDYTISPNTQAKFSSNDVHDIFNNIFGANAGFHHSQYTEPKNKNIKAKLEVSLDSILHNQTRAIHLNTGRSEKTVLVNIPAGVNSGATIRYTGYGQDILTRVPPGDLIVTITVSNLSGFERNKADILSRLKVDAVDAILGTEVLFNNIDGSRINIKVPAGAQQGQTLRVSGKGLPSNDTIGNLMLAIDIVVPKDLSDEKKEILQNYRSL